MKHKRLKLSTVLLLGLGLTGLQAQNAVPATGGNASGSGGSSSYTIGQVVYTSNTGSNGTVKQGVQQIYIISVVTEMEEAKGINLSISAYPNPTSDYLQLKIESEMMQNLNYQLFDMNGKLLQNEKIVSNPTNIIMNKLMPANYIVKVIQGSREIKTFKIIKN